MSWSSTAPGLLGADVGGLPGTQNEWACWIVSLLLVAIGALTVCSLRWRDLF